MKFVHIADVHLDHPFRSLSDKENLGDKRRLDQRGALKKVIDYIKENNIHYLFIAGDLYEDEYVTEATMNYVNNLFNEIKDCKVFITPGNHDPLTKNSFYDKFNFPSNVFIFEGNLECIETEDANIYGFGFTDFYQEGVDLTKIRLTENSKHNILIIHGDLNGSENDEKIYNPMLESELEALGMDYIALGHIHKPYYNEKKNQRIVYPGSLCSFGFDEQGEHGMIVGDLEKNKLDIKFIKLDETEFVVLNQDVQGFSSKEDLIEYLNDLKLEKNNLYEITLIGKRNFDINTRDILKLVSNPNILKIKDETKIGYDLDELKCENTLKGLFVKEALEKMESENYTEEEIEKAIEIGLENM